MKRKKNIWLMLVLVMGTIFMNSCAKVGDDPLGGSRPIYTGDGSDELPQTNNLTGSVWMGVSNEFTLKVEFTKSECLFTGYDYVTRKDTVAAYTYRFSWPTLTLTPKIEHEGVVTGTVKNKLSNYTMTFADAAGSVVWKQVEIKKTSLK